MLSRTPRLLADFDGSFDNLPRGSIQTLGLFERPHVLVCERERYLLLCAMPDGVVCGERDRRSGGLKAETLVVEMMPCFRIVKQFWLLSDRTWAFRPANICWGVGNMGSAYLNTWRLLPSGVEKRFKVQVHRILGWTFLCPPELSDQKWSDAYEYDHVDVNHQNNDLMNLKIRTTHDHRVLSGQLGGRPMAGNANEDSRAHT